MPILVSIESVFTPFLGPIEPLSFTLNFGTKNKLIPLVPDGPPGIFAKTKWIIFSVKSWSPEVIKIFCPVSKKEPSFWLTAYQRITIHPY